MENSVDDDGTSGDVHLRSGHAGQAVLRRSQHHVTMGDVDAAGVIFFTAPYEWREVLFTRWLHACGHPLSGLIRAGTPPVCVSSSASYLGPIKLDDVVDLALVVERLGRTSLDLRMDGHMEGRRVVEVRTRNVWTARHGDGLRSTPLPEWLVQRANEVG